MTIDHVDAAESERQKQLAMARVLAAAPTPLVMLLYQAIFDIAILKPTFTGDDVWEWFRHKHPSVVVPERRVLGPLMKKCSAAGLIDYIGIELSQRVSRHRGHHGEWMSLI